MKLSDDIIFQTEGVEKIKAALGLLDETQGDTKLEQANRGDGVYARGQPCRIRALEDLGFSSG